MDEIIKQIVQIDTVAISTKENNEEAIRRKQEKYEREIESYRQANIEEAKKRAEAIYNQILNMGIEESKLGETRSKAYSAELEERYMAVEAKLLEEIFQELLEVEA